MGFPLPTIQHLESAMEQMEMELYHDNNSSDKNDGSHDLTETIRCSPRATWWTSPIPPSRQCRSKERNVSFREDLITHIHERPKTTPGERDELFYSSDDVKRFRREYKLFTTLQRQRWMLAQQRQRQQHLQYYSLLPTTQLLDSASSTVSQWLTSVTQLLSLSSEPIKSLDAASNYATSPTATTIASSKSCCHAEAAATISEPNMFLIDTLYLF